MDQYILIGIMLLLAAYGCAELILRLVARVFQPPAKAAGLYVLPLSGRCVGVEYTVRSLFARQNLPVVILDRGVDEETREVIRRLQAEFSCLHLCTPENFEKMWNIGLQ